MSRRLFKQEIFFKKKNKFILFLLSEKSLKFVEFAPPIILDYMGFCLGRGGANGEAMVGGLELFNHSSMPPLLPP